MCCVHQEVNKGGTGTCLHLRFQKTTLERVLKSISKLRHSSLPQRAILAFSKLLCFSKVLFSWQSQLLAWLCIGTTQQLKNKWEGKRNLQIGSHPRDKSGGNSKGSVSWLFSQISGLFKFHPRLETVRS